MVREIDVLRAYQTHCLDRQLPSFPQGFDPKHFKQVTRFLKWCGKNDIDDPIGYLGYWFKVGDHNGQPPEMWKMTSARLAELWKRWLEGEHLEEVRYERLKQRAGSRSQQQIKALRILTRGHEAVKAPYWQKQQHTLCLTEIELSGGFHPESRYCAHCPVAVRCAAKLYTQHGFDVVSLRAGRLRDLPADVAAAAVS